LGILLAFKIIQIKKGEKMKRILLADDDLLYRKIITDVLEEEGYEVVAVSSGNMAYIQLQTEDFDLVILDAHMPEITGLEILGFLNKDAEFSGKERIPVIMITGDYLDKIEKEARKNKVSGFILKPFEAEDLIDQINRVKEERVAESEFNTV
jgi:two-component system chemotaxis response regulator CheY